VGDRKSIICSHVAQLLFIGLMAISMTCGTKHPVKYRAVPDQWADLVLNFMQTAQFLVSSASGLTP
jgi:hypothetical protein